MAEKFTKTFSLEKLRQNPNLLDESNFGEENTPVVYVEKKATPKPAPEKKNRKKNPAKKSETVPGTVFDLEGETWTPEILRKDGKTIIYRNGKETLNVLYSEDDAQVGKDLWERYLKLRQIKKERAEGQAIAVDSEEVPNESEEKVEEETSEENNVTTSMENTTSTIEPKAADHATNEPTTLETKKEYVPLHKRIEQILQGKDGTKIIQILNKKTLIAATHGKKYKSKETGEEQLIPQTDLDGKLTGYILGQAGILIKQQDFVEAGTKKEGEDSKKNADIYFDAEEAGEVLSVRKDENTGKEYIAFGNHYTDRQEKTSSAEILYMLFDKASKLEKFKKNKKNAELIEGFKKLQNDKALKEFIRFNNDTDNLLVPKEVNSDYENQLPVTLYGLYRILPFEDIKAHFESGKTAIDPVDDAVLNRKITVGSNGKTKEITLKQKVIETINGSQIGIKKARKEMAENFYVNETPELGRLLINDRKTSPITMKEIARFKGYNSTITLGDEGAFVSCPGRNIEAYGKKLQEKFPEIVLVNSMLIYRPQETTFDKQEFLKALNLIDENEKFKATFGSGKKFKNKEGQILVVGTISSDSFTYTIDGAPMPAPETIEAFREQCEKGEWQPESIGHSLRENMRSKFTTKEPEGLGYPEEMYEIFTEEEITQRNIDKQPYRPENDDPIFKEKVKERKLGVLEEKLSLDQNRLEQLKERYKQIIARREEIRKIKEAYHAHHTSKESTEESTPVEEEVGDTLDAKVKELNEKIEASSEAHEKALDDKMDTLRYEVFMKRNPGFEKVIEEAEKERTQILEDLEEEKVEAKEDEAKKITERVESLKEVAQYLKRMMSIHEFQDEAERLIKNIEAALQDNDLERSITFKRELKEYLINPIGEIESRIKKEKEEEITNPDDKNIASRIKFYQGLKQKVLNVLTSK